MAFDTEKKLSPGAVAFHYTNSDGEESYLFTAYIHGEEENKHIKKLAKDDKKWKEFTDRLRGEYYKPGTRKKTRKW